MESDVRIGLIPVLDPRIDAERVARILGPLRLREKLEELGVTPIVSEPVAVEEDAVREALRLRDSGASGIIYYTGWFLRSNVIAGACQHSQLPALVWAIPSMDNAAVVGFGVTHGALAEVGVAHEAICDSWNENARRKMLAWARACHARRELRGSRYGQIGGRCLSMMPADADANQWRWQFGIDVDHAEQWTLIQEARQVPDEAVALLVSAWKKEFAVVDVSDEVLARSARLYLAGREMFTRNRWDFAGIKCQFELIDNYLAPCLPIALWNDDGYVVACESDMNAALTMFALHKMGSGPVMFSDIQYVDMERKFARFLNCGTGATRLGGGRGRVELKDCPEVQGTLDEKTGKHLCQGGACTHWLLLPGKVTLARFGRIQGRYVLHVATGESFAYPHNREDMGGIGGVWPWAYVRPEQDMERFVQCLRAHHICIVPGEWEPELRALARLWGVEVLA